jgi:hypothetical protein
MPISPPSRPQPLPTPPELPRAPSPRRVAAGRRNHSLRGPHTAEERTRLREAALRNQPWRHASGPRTPAGRAQAAVNGRKRQAGPVSRRQLQAGIDAVFAEIAELWQKCRDIDERGELPSIPQ